MDREACGVCDGSGEGSADGTSCWHCKGDGVEPDMGSDDFMEPEEDPGDGYDVEAKEWGGVE